MPVQSTERRVHESHLLCSEDAPTGKAKPESNLNDAVC